VGGRGDAGHFSQALAGSAEYDGGAAPSTWLYTVARSTGLSALRSDAHRRTLAFDSITEPAAKPGGNVLNKIELERRLERLPDVQREVITSFYLQEKSVGEVARMLDLPEGTVKSHLHRARLALDSQLRAAISPPHLSPGFRASLLKKIARAPVSAWPG
jgi:RNA polymerase sigma-70 factor (ECF subfamily)